jgi:hypothetical protein
MAIHTQLLTCGFRVAHELDREAKGLARSSKVKLMGALRARLEQLTH